MKTINQIKEAINYYEELLTLTKHKISILESCDKTLYDTNNNIERIDFDSPSEVCVKWDEGDRYGPDYSYFSFPLEWLAKTDEELKEIVTAEKELRLEKERQVNEFKKSAYDKIMKQKELETYNKLKAKYG